MGKLKHCYLCFFLLFGLLFEVNAQSSNDLISQKPAAKQPSNFTGTVLVKMYTDPKNQLNCSMGSVSFQPGARTNWHKHPGGQILLITEGTAFYQERGGVKRILQKGDVVSCPPNLAHWHGASATSTMTHLAVGPNTDRGAVTWLEKVEDGVYLK